MFYEKCFRFRLLKKSNASEFATAPASFFKVLSLPQKFNRFRFHFLASNKQQLTQKKLENQPENLEDRQIFGHILKT